MATKRGLRSYQATGLIGRSSELKTLRKYLLNKRVPLISIVAPGGIGKTALLAHLLETIVSDTGSLAAFDAVIWTSAKTQELTAEGIKDIDAIHTLEEVESEALDVLSRKTEENETPKLADGNILLAIDNLENLLREDFEAFRDFQLGLPSSWRVIVTSRIRVPDGLVFPLGPLKKPESLDLCRRYMRIRGLPDFSDITIQEICARTAGNALAIRLFIDRLALGQPISEAVDTTSEDVAEFAFSGLLQALSALEQGVIAAALVVGSFSRLEAQQVLDCDVDRLTEGLSHLCDLGILVRDIDDFGGNRYLLAEAVQAIATRTVQPEVLRSMANRVRKQRASSPQGPTAYDSSRPQSHYLSYDNSYPPALKALLFDISALFTSRRPRLRPDKVTKLIKQLETARAELPNSPNVARFLAQLYFASGDRKSYAENLDKASVLSAPSDLRWAFQTGMNAADDRLDDCAAKHFTTLWDAGWIDPDVTCEETAIALLVRGSKVFRRVGGHKYILSKTAFWLRSEVTRRLCGPPRILALAEQITERAGDDLNKALELLSMWRDTIEKSLEYGSHRPSIGATAAAFQPLADAAYGLAVGGAEDSVLAERFYKDVAAVVAQYLPECVSVGALKPENVRPLACSLGAMYYAGNPFLAIDLASLPATSVDAKHDSDSAEWGTLRIVRRPRKTDVAIARYLLGASDVAIYLNSWHGVIGNWHALKPGDVVEAIVVPGRGTRAWHVPATRLALDTSSR